MSERHVNASIQYLVGIRRIRHKFCYRRNPFQSPFVRWLPRWEPQKVTGAGETNGRGRPETTWRIMSTLCTGSRSAWERLGE